MNPVTSPDLTTTNVLLGIMAFMSMLEAIVFAGGAVGAFLMYRRIMRVISGVEERQIAPAAARVNAILNDVQAMTSSIRQSSGRMMGLLRWVAPRFRGRRREFRREDPL